MQFIVLVALVALVASVMSLEELDLHPDNPSLSFPPRNPPPSSPLDQDPANTRPTANANPNGYTADTSFHPAIATSSVHTGGIGQGSTASGEAPSTTSGVLGPNTTGSAPSGGNVVPASTHSIGMMGNSSQTGTSTETSASTWAGTAGAVQTRAGAAVQGGMATEKRVGVWGWVLGAVVGCEVLF